MYGEGDRKLSESIHCLLCHDVVWFGAYGTSKPYVKFKQYKGYVYYSPICEDCLKLLNTLPIEKIEDEAVKN